MALKLGELVAYLKTDNKQLTTGLAAGEAEFRRSGATMERESAVTSRAISAALGAGGARGAEQFVRDALGRLHDSRGRFVAESSLLGQAAGAAGGGINGLGRAASAAGSGVNGLASKVRGLIPELGITLGVILAIVPAAYLLGGVLGSLPALTTGGIAAVAALGLGFMGLSDAFKTTAQSGGSYIDRAYQVAQANRRLRDANEEVLRSERDLQLAREEAAEDLEDRNRDLNEARTSAAEAALDVFAAQQALNNALAKGDPYEIARARLALDRAQQSVERTRDQVEDLTLAQARSAAAGVEGSDRVQDALDRQRRAVESVTDAQHALAEAQRPQGSGAANDVTKLAPAAAETVAVIKSLKGDFESLRLDIQERLFSGVGPEIKLLSAAWLETLHTRLGSMAGMFNGLFKSWSATSRNPEFVDNIAAGWEHIERLIDRVGRALVGPGLDAFGRLSRAAGPMIDAIGDGIGGIVEDLSAWIKTADESGALEKFFADSALWFGFVVDVGKDAARIIGSIISILSGAASDDFRNSGMEDFRVTMDNLADWFEDPANREKIQGFFKKIEDLVVWVKNTAIPTLVDLTTTGQKWIDRLSGWGDKVSTFRNQSRELFSGFKDSFKESINWIIERWNSLRFSVPEISWLGVKIGGQTIGTSRITPLANGGVVRATPGGRLALIGEGGQDEIVAPEGKLRQILSDVLRGGGMGGVLTVVLETRGLLRDQRRQIRWQGGDVQVVMGPA